MEASEPFNFVPKPYCLTFLIHMKGYIIFVEKHLFHFKCASSLGLAHMNGNIAIQLIPVM